MNLYLCAPALRDRLSVTTTATRDMATGLPVILQDGTYTYVYGLGMIYWVDGSGNVTYRLTDGLGSTVALCNGSGTVTDSWTYDVFGAVKTHTGTNGSEFTFTGEQNDPNGLEYLRARYYDPTVGRFLGRDPLGGGYPYAGNNPANMVDPSGLYQICGLNEGYGGLVCFDSTQVGLPLCTSDGVDCHRYQGDGSAPGNVEFPILCDSTVNACVMANGDIYGATGVQCFDLFEGEDNCNAYLGNINFAQPNVRVTSPFGVPYCLIGDLNCNGDRPRGTEQAFLQAAGRTFCVVNPQVTGCNGGSLPLPLPTPPEIAGRRFSRAGGPGCAPSPDVLVPFGCE